MADALSNRTNDAQSISPNRGTPPKPKGGGGFQDLPLANLFPTAQNPMENVLGAQGFNQNPLQFPGQSSPQLPPALPPEVKPPAASLQPAPAWAALLGQSGRRI